MAFIAPTRLPGDPASYLRTHRYLVRAASAILSVFLWIFIFQYFSAFTTVGRALIQTLLLYALAQTIAILLIPFAMRRMRGGMRRGLVYGTLTLIAALVYSGVLLGGLFPNGTAMIGILLGAYGALYRVPYTIEHAVMGSQERSGLFGEMLLAALPFLTGIALTRGIPAHTVFFESALLPLLALVPLFLVPNVHETFSWGYRETFGHLVAPENRGVLLRSLWQGISAALLFLAWPLILLFTTPSYLVLGAAFSATLFTVFLFRASTRPAVVEQHADGGTYLDEYTSLKEMGLALGRLVLCFALVALVLLFQ